MPYSVARPSLAEQYMFDSMPERKFADDDLVEAAVADARNRILSAYSSPGRVGAIIDATHEIIGGLITMMNDVQLRGVAKALPNFTRSIGNNGDISLQIQPDYVRLVAATMVPVNVTQRNPVHT